MHCDVLVVGAAISGILAAKNAAKNNFKTLLVDEKNELCLLYTSDAADEL